MRQYTTIAADVAQKTTLLCLALYTLDPNNSANTWTITILRSMLIPSAMEVMNTYVMKSLQATFAFTAALLLRKNVVKPDVATIPTNSNIMEMADCIHADPNLMRRVGEAIQAMNKGDLSQMLELYEEIELTAVQPSIQEMPQSDVEVPDLNIVKEGSTTGVETNGKPGISFMKVGGLKEMFAPASVASSVKRTSSDPMLVDLLAEQLVDEARELNEDADALMADLLRGPK